MIVLSPVEVAIYYAARVPDLRQRGMRWRGRCPIHRGKNDNFSVDSQTGLWHCWSSCGRGGDIIALEIELTGVSWRDAVEEIERIIGRALLDRPASRAQRRVFAEHRDAASAETERIMLWRDASILELNVQKIAAVETGDDETLSRVAWLCNTLENGSPADVVREFIRHQANDPAKVEHLIAAGLERDIESKRIAAQVVLLLAHVVAKDSRDAA
jgi:hypothetical protein